MRKTITALTIKEIDLSIESGRIIPKNTPILIDPDRSVAFWGGWHFDIFQDEYRVVN